MFFLGKKLLPNYHVPSFHSVSWTPSHASYTTPAADSLYLLTEHVNTPEVVNAYNTVCVNFV
jgi:hypothetical protein